MHEAADPATTLSAGGGSSRGTEVLLAELQPELEVVRRLGEGSTADVFLAREPALQRLVAVKVLRADLAADRITCKRFEREAQSAARLSHPHVTGIHRVGRLSTDLPFMVMEYIDGRTVRDIVDARGAFPLPEARELLASIAAALAAAHDHGIVHRDVRPENIFVENRTGRAVLSDFGIAARLESGVKAGTQLTAAGVLLGDTRYMSPEQLRGEPITEQSDVYSFGLLAYEVLTGRGPYDAANDAQHMVAHLTHAPKPLRTLAPSLDVPWQALIEHCLSKDPNRRPRAAEVAAALVTGTPAGGPVPVPGSPLSQFLSEMRRRRVYQVLVGYGAVAIAVLGAAEVVNEAWDLPKALYQSIVFAALAGFPVALALSWIYDISATGIERTRDTGVAPRARLLLWLALALSVAGALAIGWLLLDGGGGP